MHLPPATFNTEAIPGAGWRNIVKAWPGIPWLRRRLWSPHWARVVMNRECRALVEALGPQGLKTLEISGHEWGKLYRFKEYQTTDYPEYDVCEKPLAQTFDLIVAEQVFEHLLWPYRAGRNILQMLNPGGHFLISTPFLIKIHGHPIDCSRWTELGLKHLLAECGFPIERIKTYSWGNRACVKKYIDSWASYRWWRSLRNEPEFPIVVWALAQKEPG
jgi:SAM-dependent methyltransferase